MSKMKNRLWILLLALFIGACSQFEPFNDSRREAGKIQTVGQSSPLAPAICYNPLWHDLTNTEQIAQTICNKQNKKAIFKETVHFSCRLFNPSTAHYDCE